MSTDTEDNFGLGGGGADTSESTQTVERPVRPDYIPENFWDADKGFKGEEFASLVALKTARDADLAQVPADATAYDVKLPKSFQLPQGLELSKGQTHIINASDPRVVAAREFAFTKHMSQADFEDLIAFGVKIEIDEQSRFQAALSAEVEKLGAKGKERVSAITAWLGAKLGGDLSNALLPYLYTAKSVQAFEALMRLNRGAVPGTPGAGRDSGKAELSDEEYSKMSASERINYGRKGS